MRVAGALLCAAALLAAYHLASNWPLNWRPGVLIGEDPVQNQIEPAEAEQSFNEGDFRLIPRARFRATVRVLAYERYHFGPFAAIAPLDVAAGWGPMSDSAVLADIEVWQANRFYYWNTRHWPIPRATIETHSANFHLVPADAQVRRALGHIRVGSLVTLDGELIDIQHPQLGLLRTSLRRDDTGAGACEIIHVQAVTFRYDTAR